MPTTLPPWWIFAIGALTGAVAAFVLGIARDEIQRRRRIGSCWSAVYAEFAICSQKAVDYLAERPVIMAPSYRWPTVAYESALPELLIEARLSVNDATALLHFFEQVESINLGLDQAHEAIDDDEAIHREFQRNVAKIRSITPGAQIHVRALGAFARHSAVP